jgi:hypothetical protein
MQKGLEPLVRWHPLSSISLIDMTFKTLIKKAERDPRSKSVFTAKMYEVIEGRVIPDWKKSLLVLVKISSRLLDISAITLPNILIRQFSPRRAITLPGRFIF